TRPRKPRSATISIRWSASSRYTSTPLLAAVSQTRRREKASSARWRASTPANTARRGSADSTAKQVSPVCVASPRATASAIRCRLSSRNRRAAEGANRCRNRRPIMAPASPAAGGAAAPAHAAAAGPAAPAEAAAAATAAAPAAAAPASAPGPAAETAPAAMAHHAPRRRLREPEQQSDEGANSAQEQRLPDHPGDPARGAGPKHAAHAPRGSREDSARDLGDDESREQRDHPVAADASRAGTTVGHRFRQRLALDQPGQHGRGLVESAAEV